jgi:putative heme-binding domain-containing protein
MRKLFIALLLPAIVVADPPDIATTPHLSPAQEKAAFTVPDGFEVQLVAAEPDIQKPINLAFDAKGRLWVTCSVEYPYAAPEGKGRDTVKILSEFGPDGGARKIETFADGLNIPIGILPYQDGAIVYSIPNLWMLRDTKGTGKCDKREVLFSGFGHRDTHGMVNGLFLGFDGWVYANHGYSNDSKVKGKDGHEISMNSGNVFRFKPDGSRVELFAKGQVNPFGSCMDKWGNLYTACCHSKPITLVLRGGVYESFSKPHDGLGFAPAMVHEYRGSTALCGLAWYDADYFPKEYQEHFYLGDVVYNCINKFNVTWKGATPTAKQEGDFLTSKDPWFRPCDIKLGPDGALYVADFYNRIIGHYEVELGHPGRDRNSGRIWRIVRKDKPLPAVPDRTKSTPAELVKDLDSPNITARFLAMNQLVARGREVVPDVRQGFRKDAPPLTKSHAYWIWQRLGLLASEPTPDSPDPRENQSELLLNHKLRVMEEVGRGKISDLLTLGSAYLSDQFNNNAGLKRLILEMEGRQGGGWQECTENLKEPAVRNDPFLLHTVRMVLRDCLVRDGLPADDAPKALWNQLADVALGANNVNGGELLRVYAKKFEFALNPDQVKHCARYSIWDDGTLNDFVNQLEREHKNDLTALRGFVLAVAEGWAQRGTPMPERLTSWCEKVALAALASPDPPGIQRGVDIAIAIRQPKVQDAVAAIVNDKSRPAAVRAVCLPALGASHAALVIHCLADGAETPPLREHAAKTLAGVNKPESRAALAEALATAPANLASIIALSLSSSKPGSDELLNVVDKGQASPRLLTDRSVLFRLEANGFKDRVRTLTAGLPAAAAQIEELIKKRRAGFQTAKPDIEAGKLLFTKHCAICHQIAGQGAKIGPQLDGIGIRGLDRLLEDVLDPNRNVDPAFRAVNLQLADGRSLSGLIIREEGQVVVLADAQGKEQSIPKNQIEQRTTSPLSAMPANVADVMSETEFYALMAYLLSQKR